MSIFKHTFVIGDIHGELDKFLSVLEQCKFDYENDRLISVGDLCDRGPQSREVVNEILKMKHTVCIRGNHDKWFNDFLDTGHAADMWLRQGGYETLQSYVDHSEDYGPHRDFYSAQRNFFVEKNICFVHGGFDVDRYIDEQDSNELYWDRELVEKMMSCGPDKKLKHKDNFDMIFIGHTPTLYWKEDIKGIGSRDITTPIFKGGVWNIDTGSGKGGKLTIMDLETKEYWQS